MYYFLPAWYRGDQSWDSREQVWYYQHEHGFDDTTNQVRMFTSSGQAAALLVPVFFPNLRHFAYQQGIYEVPRLAVFDYLQGIPADLPVVNLDYHDFAWPADANYVYNPFTVTVFSKGQRYAQLSMGPEGNLIVMDLFKNDQRYRQLDFDDRGFVSRVSEYNEQQQLVRQAYLDHLGNEQFYVAADGQVHIVGGAHLARHQGIYPDLRSLITEQFTQFVQEQIQPADLVVAAADPFHDQMLGQVIPNDQLVMSYFGDRAALTEPAEAALAQQALLTIADSNYNQKRLEASGAKVLQLPPLDTRLSLGISNQERLLKIMLLIDGLSAAALRVVLEIIMKTMNENELIDLTLLTFRGGQRQAEIEALVAELDERLALTDQYTFNQVEAAAAENQLADDLDAARENARKRDIHFVTVSAEPQLIQAIHTTRLLIDLSPQPDVFLQIAGISAGIPEILRAESLYVEDGKNGRLLQNVTTDLAPAIHFYLDRLKNWNTALVHAANKIADYTSGRIVKRLQAAIKEAR